MSIEYKFSADNEPTDEQLHLLMKEVAKDAQLKAKTTNELFWKQLEVLIDSNNRNYSSFTTQNR